MKQIEESRIAWLLPAMGTGGISFQHILCEFAKIFPNTVAFTGQWPGFAPGFENSFNVREVGATRYIQLAKTANGYTVGFSYASPQIISRLLQFKPEVIFANAFSIWTAIALCLKPLVGWRVIIIYEGSSPGVDYRDATVRLFSRQVMVQHADAFVANGQRAKAYLVKFLGAKEDRVFSQPFLVPSVTALLQDTEDLNLEQRFQVRHPTFLYVGQIIPRKGLKVLLEACSILNSQGYSNYTLLIIGEGEQRQELEAFAKISNLEDQIRWVGQVEYRRLGNYFQKADVF
ncbi:MAG: glycosyltransferase, partial [Chroococcidiopsidaceae cyanobacterium CP_BM_RX_35]|nr:glycosyltransferase [Chroococcidiopsidaceae cyanobacterium CP_BM_RX_35]